MRVRARKKFMAALDQAIENVKRISGMIEPEIREVVAGRMGTLKAIKIDANPTALQANLAIISYAIGKPAEHTEGQRITVPIQINMGGGKMVDVAVAPVQVAMEALSDHA